MLRKKTHVVRKKTHVVRKLFYVASIFGGAAGCKNRAAGCKNRPPWELSSTAWELSSTAGDFLPTALPFDFIERHPFALISKLLVLGERTKDNLRKRQMVLFRQPDRNESRNGAFGEGLWLWCKSKYRRKGFVSTRKCFIFARYITIFTTQKQKNGVMPDVVPLF